MSNQKTIGNRGETIATWYLRAKGYQILERNFHVRGGEIDIVCQRGKAIIFVEVKTKRSAQGGRPEEMVTPTKINRFIFAAQCYLQRYQDAPPWRLDVMSVDLTHHLPRLHHLKNVSWFD